MQRKKTAICNLERLNYNMQGGGGESISTGRKNMTHNYSPNKGNG